MLYESTKGLLQSILRSLETGDATRWDDQTESGNACLYEMHQMSGPLYKAYKSDGSTASAAVQSNLSKKVNRAMPHIRTMVIAIRHKDQTLALESGKAALAELNGPSPAEPSARSKAPTAEHAVGRPAIAEAARLRGAAVKAAKATETPESHTTRKSVGKKAGARRAASQKSV